MTTVLVIIIVALVLCFQFKFFSKNRKRMKEFMNIFPDDDKCYIERNDTTDYVTGISSDTDDNKIFLSIKQSINKYLENNAGSVIDFNLLKDAVDRHCDAVEDEINNQTPVPLYCGLAGTMAGVIVGLASLLFNGSITSLMSGVGNVDAATDMAAAGVNHLLEGVALAMLASIVGIILTTFNSLNFKECKLLEERGKNSFLAWMQSSLLPELPSDTSDVMKQMVKNLNRFNGEFTKNINVLSGTFSQVKETFTIQAQIINDIKQMDVVRMARANVAVLRELKDCTDKLEAFNDYLSKMDEFNMQFSRQAETQDIFKKISEFFGKHKKAISKNITNTDACLKEAMDQLKDNSSKEIKEMQKRMTELSDSFRTMMREEQDAFTSFSKALKREYEDHINVLPTTVKKLEEISRLPQQLDALSTKISDSNAKLAKSISASNAQLAEDMEKFLKKLPASYSGSGHAGNLSTGMKVFLYSVGGIMALSNLYLIAKVILAYFGIKI